MYAIMKYIIYIGYLIKINTGQKKHALENFDTHQKIRIRKIEHRRENFDTGQKIWIS
jgi:hypothetical protein